MTFLGFVLAVVIIGVIFYAWYAYAHRDGGEDVARVRDNRLRRAQTATNVETGTIGELDDEVEGVHFMRDHARMPSRHINAGRYLEETGLIGDLPSREDIDVANATVRDEFHEEPARNAGSQEIVSAIHQAFQEEIGDIGSTATGQVPPVRSQQPQKPVGNDDDLTEAIHQAFRNEFYSMNDQNKKQR